jgi:hypothetical protein
LINVAVDFKIVAIRIEKLDRDLATGAATAMKENLRVKPEHLRAAVCLLGTDPALWRPSFMKVARIFC